MRTPPTFSKLPGIQPVAIALLTLLSFSTQGQNLVDIGLYPSPTPNVLEIRVRPSQNFNLVVSEVTFTIRWSTASGASLGTIDQNIDGNSCAQTTIPLVKSGDGQVDVGGSRYQTISGFGFQQLQQCTGYSWPGGQETVIARIPITNNTGCTAFNIVNDGYTTANNKDFYLSLGGEPSTGVILSTPAQFGSCAGLIVSAKAILDGPYNTSTGLMGDLLRSNSLIPSSHPYSGAPWNYSGTETRAASVLLVTGNNAIVDWVLLELRASGAPATIVARRAALIQRDGDIVDTDGVGPVLFSTSIPNNYHIAVRHRNHLGVMTANTYALSLASPSIDLTLASTPTYGVNARRVRGGVVTMWGGNANNTNSLINYNGFNNDRQAILTMLGAATFLNPQSGYHRQDVNMNAVVNYNGLNNDRQFILSTLGASTFLNPISEQLP